MAQDKFRQGFDQTPQQNRQSKTDFVATSYKDSFNGDIEYDINFINVTPYTVDESIHLWFTEQHPMFITRGETQAARKVDVLWSSAERWAMIAKNQQTRDKNGMLILPLISLRRTSEEPIYERTVAVDADGTTNFRLYVHEYINAVTMKKEYALKTNIDTNVPVLEIIEITPPKIMKFQYDIIFWSNYQSDLNFAVNHMVLLFGNKHATYINENLFFGARLESISDGSNDEQIGADERIFKKSFTVVVEAPLISADSIRRYKTPRYTEADATLIGKEEVISLQDSNKIRDKIQWHDSYKLRR